MRVVRSSLPDRVIALDGLRALASLVVVVRHTSNAIPANWLLRSDLLESPLAILLNSQGAVQLFFVLSGYVLTASVNRTRGWSGLAQFFTKRAFRLHPPFVVTVLFSWLLSFWFLQSLPGPDLTGWIARSTNVQLSFDQVLASLTYPGMAFGLVPHGWTLTVEMIFSLLLPVMVLIAQRFHWSVLIALSALTIPLATQLPMLRFSIDFSLGIALYLERDRIERFFTAIPHWLSALLVFAFLFLFAAPLMLGWSRPVASLGIIVGLGGPASNWIMGVGSAGLVAAAVSVPFANRWLSKAPLAYLGKISFSIYLFHRVFITLFAPYVSTGSRWIDAAFLLGSVVAATVAVAAFCYRYVERPSIRAGNWVCRRISSEAMVSKAVDRE
jgi:peptidoglycan/LPS O-acetylase OafA/YrhL